MALSLHDFGDGHWVEVHRVVSSELVRRYVDFSNDMAGAEPPPEPWTIATCGEIELDDLVECVGDVRDQRLADALVALGVDVEAAPDAAVEYHGEDFCGVVSMNSDFEFEPVAPSACFVDHVERGPAATFVEERFTDEGDPIIMVFRTAGTPDGVTIYTDSSPRHLRFRRVVQPSCESVELRRGTVWCT